MCNATFIGIDLAWKSERNPTAAATLKGGSDGAELVSVATLRSVHEILQYVRAQTTDHTVIAIDAPLIITNETGQRLCETAIGRRYGKHHASCHTSNLGLYKDAASVVLTNALLDDGFEHPRIHNDKQRRVIAEVYPHAAMVALFNLQSIIKYKKGLVASRRQGLEELRVKLRRLSQAEPSLIGSSTLKKLLTTDLHLLTGQALKNYEDILDAVFCAYLALYFWRWRWQRNELFGDVLSGYILNPKQQPL
jgi:predicted RNase H-like nuclease